MGTYLSTPVVDKDTDEGECLDDSVSPMAWGVVEMQGWRKTMEDAHVAQTDVDLHWDSSAKAKVFGVFDGHGGPEVARFCQLYLVEALTKQEAWKEEMSEEVDANANAKDPASTAVGKALIHSFHTLDRMIDDSSRRDELSRLRNYKPKPNERRTIDSIPVPLKPVHASSAEPQQVKPENKPNNTVTQDTSRSAETARDVEPVQAEVASGDDQQHQAESSQDKLPPDQQPPDVPPDPPPPDEANEEQQDEDSANAVGMEDGEDIDFPMEDDDCDTAMVEIVSTENTFSFQSFVGSLKAESGQVMATLSSPRVGGESTSTAPEDVATAAEPAPAPPLGMVATIIQNGRQYCNLPDHPIHAGCTAIVAVIIGRTLTVANAGDSRAVLCRAGGRTEALSFDHKPHQVREMLRIANSGGFVNQFGRVNGNLNLSRSIGDLKYKQIPGLSPAEQMITAEPDIVQVTLHADDEFIILGCDGIWDCLSNDQAVKYVRDRIDVKSPTEIGTEMLDDIISDDPRASQGIGGDNMTVMVIDLQPSTRAYR